MALLTTWPAFTDDSGTKEDGTPIAQATLGVGSGGATMKASIEALIHSATNPTISPADAIDEQVTARGSKATLDERLDVVLNEDGTLKSQASLQTVETTRTMIGARNLFPDSLCKLWPDGDAAAPWGWTLSGAGAAVARAGTGLSDTQTLRNSAMCIKLTRAGADAKVTRVLISSTKFKAGLRNRVITVGCAALAPLANQASIVVDDGVTTTRGGLTGNATYHSGGGTEEWLYLTHTISGSATKLDIYVEVANSDGAAYFGALVAAFSDVAVEDWSPERMGSLYAGIAVFSTLTTGDGKTLPQIRVPRAGLFMGLAGAVATAPTGQAVTFDCDKTTDLSSWVAIYTTKPDIDAGEKEIDDGARTAPDGTYARRCFNEGDFIRVNIDQVGSGVAGADFTGDLMFLCPLNDLEEAL